MTSRCPQTRSSGLGFFAQLAVASPLRYGVVAVIVVTLGYTSIRIVPMIHLDRELLREVYAVDERGISLEGDLQFQIQESRRQYLSILSSQSRPEEIQNETQSLQSYDAVIARTESTIADLKPNPGHSPRQFHQDWLRYVALRNTVLASLKSGPDRVNKVDSDGANSAILQLDQAARSGKAAFEASSALQIAQVSDTLQRTLREYLIAVFIKIVVLSLLVWTDWKRLRAERQLRKATRDLQASEDRLQLTYDSAEVGMGITAMDGTILSANRVAAKILGYESGEIVGRKVRELIAPEFRESHVEQLASLVSGERSSYRSERQYISKDGTLVWVRNNVNLMKLPG